MLETLIYFFIGTALSMDAFSLSLSIGTLKPSHKEIMKTSLTIGLFHFIMPMIGYIIGDLFKKKISIGLNYLSFILFIVLAYEMYKNKDNEENKINLKLSTIILIAFSVSIDSLTVGIAFGLNNEYIYLSSMIFSLISACFTYLGLNLGKKLGERYKQKATYIGIVLLILISIKYLINV